MRLDHPRFEVLVVDNAPRDGLTREVALRRGARYIVEPVLGLNRARNRGARSCDAEIIAYLDDDSVCEPAWLSRLVDEFSDPRVMVVTGKIRPLRVETEAEKAFVLRGDFELGEERRAVDMQTPFWFEMANFGGVGNGGNMAFRRGAFDVWRGFDERIGLGTALEGSGEHHAFFSLIERGYRAVYTPLAVVDHPLPQTLTGVRSKCLRNLSAGAAYATLLLFEHPHYRVAVLKYVLAWLRGMPRTWRRRVAGPRTRIVPRWRELLARLHGPLLYARAVVAHKIPRVPWNLRGSESCKLGSE